MTQAGAHTAGLPAAAAAAAAPIARDICPCCGGGFHCGVQDSAPCACTGLQLSAVQLQALRARYSRCLCLACLAAVAAGQPV